MGWSKIITGIDFSPESETALKQALALARRLDLEVLMVHATDVVEAGSDSEVVEFLGESQKRTREALDELRERYDGQGATLSHALVDGGAAKALASVAADITDALTVVGTHGRSGLRRFLLGSVAEKVLRRTEGDVLVARPGARAGHYQRILVPTDFSTSADAALEAAIALAEPDAEIDVAHFWQLPLPMTSHYMPLSARAQSFDRLRREYEATAKSRVAEVIDRHQNDNIQLNELIGYGPPAPGIVDCAAGYDLIAMGRSGLTGLRRWLVGSVTAATVRYAPCSVLVTRGPESDS